MSLVGLLAESGAIKSSIEVATYEHDGVPYLASSKAVRRPIPEAGPVMTYAFRSDGLFKLFDITIP